MKISLNGLVELLSAMVGQPFSGPLQEQMKVVFNYKRADWMQKVIDKHPEQRKFFLKDFSVELESVDKAECPVNLDCSVFRTVEKIPAPLRSAYALFDYVGDPDKMDGYSYTSTEQLYWMVNYSKYTKDRPKYFYVNGYIYIYNEPDLGYVNIRGIWPDQRQLNPFKCDDVPCYTDEDQYDIADDIINSMMQDILKNELRLFAPDITAQTEVTVDQTNPTKR